MKRTLCGLLMLFVGCVQVDPFAGQSTSGCFRDVQCSDGVFCNGVETCFNGICFSGNNPCPGGICFEPSNQCESIIVAVPVPIVTLEQIAAVSLAVLRSACPYMPDYGLFESILHIDDGWWLGLTYGEQLIFNEIFCVSEFSVSPSVCLVCWDTIVEFVYFVAH